LLSAVRKLARAIIPKKMAWTTACLAKAVGHQGIQISIATKIYKGENTNTKIWKVPVPIFYKAISGITNKLATYHLLSDRLKIIHFSLLMVFITSINLEMETIH
jgi:hypothetical protein